MSTELERTILLAAASILSTQVVFGTDKATARKEAVAEAKLLWGEVIKAPKARGK